MMTGDPGNPLKEQLRALEETLLDAAVRRDRARVSGFLAEDFVEFGSSGRVWSRDEVLDLLATEGYQPPLMEGFECREIAPGIALVSYRTVLTDAATGKRSVTLRSSIWSKGSGVWRVRFHQGTRMV
ncbi:MAG: DUF4440 domain-containing protein [Terracidiphilus sp.]